ncbi:hypothetical protein NHQ30_009570 [Ciborinia camelliae]|nr:hypothetical protein NHQ30_009570 [Ciborinia camelliae]
MDEALILFPTHKATDNIELQTSFWPTPTSGIVGGFDPFSVLPDTTGDPLPKSTLIEYCKLRFPYMGSIILTILKVIKQLGPWLGSYDDAQLLGRPAFSWLPFALHHPPLFYATLLGAAVHLDRKQPMDKRTLFWYKIETMRLANQTMNLPNEAATDQMLLE